MGASIRLQLRSRFHPGPAARVAFLAMPLFAREPARRRRGIEMAFGLRHPSRALMARNLHDGARFFAIRTIGPWTGQLPVLVTVLGTGFHFGGNGTADEPFVA